MYQIDLNCDLGESFGRYTLGLDEQVIPLITSANVACGYHASDPLVMDRTITLAKEAGIRVGLSGSAGLRQKKYGCIARGGKGLYHVSARCAGCVL